MLMITNHVVDTETYLQQLKFYTQLIPPKTVIFEFNLHVMLFCKFWRFFPRSPLVLNLLLNIELLDWHKK